MKKAIIIGASSGIGRELARIIAANGYIVGLAARRTELLHKLNAEITSKTYIKTMDLAKPDEAIGVIACYDNDYLRIDILLNNSITFDWKTLYAVKIEYGDTNEYFTYYTDSEKLVYEKEENGKIVKTKTLAKADSNDVAGVTDSGEQENDVIYFIINKEDHIGGEKGKRYYLTCSFFSGYVTKSDEIKIADKTISVEMEFKY